MTDLCKYGEVPSVCTLDPMNCQCALDAALDAVDDEEQQSDE